MGTHPIFESDFDCLTDSVDPSETAVLTKMVCDPDEPGPSELHRDYIQPTSVERKLNRKECYRGLARCKVLEGSILADGAYKFKMDDEFPIYSPITHHAISLEPIGSNAKVLFTEMDPARSHLTERDFDDIYKGEEENVILNNFYSTEESSLKVATVFGPLVLSKIRRDDRICIFGGKGSGKSTTNRFMLNSLLNDHPTVYWLEMDPGQPEFNVSGWLSLVKVMKPRMGPNYPFLKNEENHFEIISQYYLGEFGRQQAARLYIRIIEQLTKVLNRLNPVCPVIFNTMEWSRELGLKFLQDSLNIIYPYITFAFYHQTSNDLPSSEDISLEAIFRRTLAEKGNMFGRPLYVDYKNQRPVGVSKIKDQFKFVFPQKFNPSRSATVDSTAVEAAVDTTAVEAAMNDSNDSFDSVFRQKNGRLLASSPSFTSNAIQKNNKLNSAISSQELVIRTPFDTQFKDFYEKQNYGVKGDDRCRRIVIDGSNLARSHGKVGEIKRKNNNKEVFSIIGIKIAVEEFWKMGCREVTVVLPHSRKGNMGKPRIPKREKKLQKKMEDLDIIKYAAGRRIQDQYIQSYDDRSILDMAVREEGIVVSNDQFRDLITVSPKYKKCIEERLLPYNFMKDYILLCNDPPRAGEVLPLEEFIRH